MVFTILIFVLFSVFGNVLSEVSGGFAMASPLWLQNLQQQSPIPEDARLNFTQLAGKYGLQCEEHVVITEDGYRLQMFHIPGDTNRPVLLSHGFIDSSDAFMIRGNTSLVKTLATKGYDVWLGDFRGNKYSQRHITLDPDKDKSFWDFSREELGLYDLPAFIDHVLANTGKQRLYLISYSDAGASVLIMGCMRPEYNKKVGLFVPLAATTDLSHTGAALSWGLTAFPVIYSVLKLAGVKPVRFATERPSEAFQYFCSRFKSFCYKIAAIAVIDPLTGFDSELFDEEFLPVLLGHYPAGSSLKNLFHITQNFLDKRFARFDYGEKKNIELYNSRDPPSYDLSMVEMVTEVMIAKNDKFVSEADTRSWVKIVPNVAAVYTLEREKASHLDFVYGKEMDKYLYPHLFEVLNKHSLD